MRRNVALLVLDTVRTDYFLEHAPRLQALADISSERCYAASSWSAPSHASMITGQLANQHGVHAHNKDFSVIQPDTTFLSEIEDHYRVGASTNIFAGSAFHFDRFFDDFASFNRFGLLPGGVNIDEFHQRYPDGIERYFRFLREAYKQDEILPSMVNGTMVKLNDILEKLSFPRLGDYGARVIMKEARKFTNTEPFFLFANFMEAHIPHQPTFAYDGSLYTVPADWSSHEVDVWDVNNSADEDAYSEYLRFYRSIYAAAIDYLDRKISKFVKQTLRQTDRETTVIITGDHGEELGYRREGGRLGHAAGFSNALLNVPFLVINAPPKLSLGKLQSHLDLGEVIVEIAEGESGSIERNAAPAERIGLGQVREPENFEYWNRGIRTVINTDERYEWDTLSNQVRYQIEGPSTERLADESIDIPNWTKSHFDTKLVEYKEMATEEGSGAMDLDSETRNRLEELGYM